MLFCAKLCDLVRPAIIPKLRISALFSSVQRRLLVFSVEMIYCFLARVFITPVLAGIKKCEIK